MTPILAPTLLLLMQVGPDPSAGAMPGLPDELADRPERGEVQAPQESLSECLREASSFPQAALDRAQAWRETAQTDLEFAQSAHCLGLALVQLGRLDEARRAFEVGSGEAPADNLSYSARLAAMAGNAALAAGDVEGALPLLDRENILRREDRPHARRLLKAAAFTYVSASLMSLLNIARWFAILRR